MGNHFCLLRQKAAVHERLTRPQRLIRQPSNLDYTKLRRFILASKLAPCYDAVDEPDPDLEECPICCLYFPSLNRSRCCSKGICTECFLQLKPSRGTPRSAQCPFCKALFYAVEYRGARTKEEKIFDQLEEQKVIEAKIRLQHHDTCIFDHIALITEARHSSELHTPKQCHGLPEVISMDVELASVEEGQSGHAT